LSVQGTSARGLDALHHCPHGLIVPLIGRRAKFRPSGRATFPDILEKVRLVVGE
jgi:hypothetical protein